MIKIQNIISLIVAMTVLFATPIINAQKADSTNICLSIGDGVRRQECLDGNARYFEEAKKTILILRRMQNRIESGVSYRDYSGVIADPKFEVKLYIEEMGEKFPEFTKALLDAIAFYDAAGSIMGFKFNSSRISEVTCNSTQEKFIVNILGSHIRQGNDYSSGCLGYVIDEAVRDAWIKGGRRIKDADLILKSGIK